MTDRVCLIVNPVAGGGRAGRLAAVAARALDARGLRVRRVDTRDLAHGRELAREAAAAGELVVVLSGDGLLGAVADTLREVPGAILGLIPGGRGNDLARVLGIPDDPAAAAAIVADGHTRPVDLGLVRPRDDPDGGRAFVGIASAGFDSDANRIANEAPSWLGGLVYAYGALRALASWRPAGFAVELEPPAERRRFVGYSVGAANSKCYGGGMHAAPSALLDDGMLEVVVLERVSKLAFLTRILPRVFDGSYVEQPCVSVFRAREIVLEADRPFTMYADGDPIAELPVRVTALPAAVTMLTPRTGESSAFAGATSAPAAAPAPPGGAAGARQTGA
jgi:YegS/Rv2252/BmrU family lipid kinase